MLHCCYLSLPVWCRAPTYVHSSISVGGAAHVAGAGAEEALGLVEAQHGVSRSRLLEQSVYVFGSVADPLGD